MNVAARIYGIWCIKMTLHQSFGAPVLIRHVISSFSKYSNHIKDQRAFQLTASITAPKVITDSIKYDTQYANRGDDEAEVIVMICR